ncbi:hypothetical protein THRCLA_11282, partial [Thraustotheca clavata]
NGYTPLHFAAQIGHQEIVSKLISAGANLDLVIPGGFTAVYIAAENGYHEVVSLLTLVETIINLADDDRSTSSHKAAWKCDKMILSLLIAAHANIDPVTHSGGTPLYFVASEGCPDIVSLLIAAEAKLNLADKHGATPLICAALEGYEEAASLRISPSANINQVSLVDVDIEQLEGDLADDPSYLGLNMDIIQEEENYRRFLTSLVPNGDDDLSFLCEEDDEEYHPHEEDEEDDEDEDDDARHHQQQDLTNSISKAELSGLLWDSSNIDVVLGSNEAKTPVEIPQKTAPSSTFRQIQPNGHSKGSLNKAQLTQLASQMHKHYQLLCQMTLLSQEHNPETEVMLADLRRRSEAVRAWKESVVAKVNPSESAATVLNSRRVTRAFSAAHAAIVNPSMYEIHALHKPLERLTLNANQRTDHLRGHLGALDYHLLHSNNFKPKDGANEVFTESEDRLLVHGVKRSGAKINWNAIQKNFLPTKSTEDLRARYRFLSSAKAPQNPVKAFISSFPPRRVAPWLIEEEIRILRGMLAFGEDERRKFSKIATQLLPHRSRNEIRKKWGRMQAEMASETTAGIDNLTPREQDIVRWQKALEKKLAIKEKSSLSHSTPKAAESDEKMNSLLPKDDTTTPQQCPKKHLHPALFYSPWAIITPSVLLDTTCEHNWPASLPFKNKKKTKSQPGDGSDTWASMAFPSDDDDSEFELEELISSEEEEEEEELKFDEAQEDLSDMDFEQVELDDDEDEDDHDGMLFDYEIDSPRQFPLSITSERTLAALERRISGMPPTKQPTMEMLDNDIEVEELADDHSDDDEFECEELLPSSDEEEDDIATISQVHKIDSARLELLSKRMSQRDG